MPKLTQNTISQQQKATKQLTPEQCEERIEYLSGMFRLEWHPYDAKKVPDDDGIDGYCYYENGDVFSLKNNNVQEYYRDFAAVDALGVFYQLCLDYCQGQLMMLRKKSSEWPTPEEFRDALNQENKQRSNKEKMTEETIDDRVKDFEQKINNNLRQQELMQNCIDEIKCELKQQEIVLPVKKKSISTITKNEPVKATEATTEIN